MFIPLARSDMMGLICLYTYVRTLTEWSLSSATVLQIWGGGGGSDIVHCSIQIWGTKDEIWYDCQCCLRRLRSRHPTVLSTHSHTCCCIIHDCSHHRYAKKHFWYCFCFAYAVLYYTLAIPPPELCWPKDSVFMWHCVGKSSDSHRLAEQEWESRMLHTVGRESGGRTADGGKEGFDLTYYAGKKGGSGGGERSTFLSLSLSFSIPPRKRHMPDRFNMRDGLVPN